MARDADNNRPEASDRRQNPSSTWLAIPEDSRVKIAKASLPRGAIIENETQRIAELANVDEATVLRVLELIPKPTATTTMKMNRTSN